MLILNISNNVFSSLVLVPVCLFFCIYLQPVGVWGGSDIFASVRENSPMGQFVSNISITVEPGENPVQLCLSGDDADWFYLQGQTIRLNTSYRVLDREVELHLNPYLT